MPEVHEVAQEAESPPRRPAQRSLFTIQQFAQTYPAFPIANLKWLLYRRKGNGLHKAVVRVGRRVLIDEDRFFQWLDKLNGEGY